jgi:hypothetical protein
VTGGSRGIGKMIAAGFLAQREPGAEKVVELNFHVAVGATAEHEDSRLRIAALRNPALSLALRNKFENQLFVGSPIDCFWLQNSLDPIEHRLSLTGARAGKKRETCPSTFSSDYCLPKQELRHICCRQRATSLA